MPGKYSVRALSRADTMRVETCATARWSGGKANLVRFNNGEFENSLLTLFVKLISEGTVCSAFHHGIGSRQLYSRGR